jgi:hypothetical protein
MRPIDDWRRWHRLWSIRLNILGSILLSAFMTWPGLALGIWNMMPIEVKEFLPPRMVMLLPLGLFVAAAVARIVKQKSDGDE